MTRRALAGPAIRLGLPTWPALAVAAGLLLAGTVANAAGVGVQRLWVLLVLAPLAEEAVFRAGIQEVLLRRTVAPAVANLLTALLFGLAHALLRADAAALAVVLPALLIGAVYERGRRLRVCVALHAVMNALWLGWGLAGMASLGHS
jgi:membrane protease YdiL (CAAX protease family)